MVYGFWTIVASIVPALISVQRVLVDVPGHQYAIAFIATLVASDTILPEAESRQTNALIFFGPVSASCSCAYQMQSWIALDINHFGDLDVWAALENVLESLQPFFGVWLAGDREENHIALTTPASESRGGHPTGRPAGCWSDEIEPAASGGVRVHGDDRNPCIHGGVDARLEHGYVGN